MEDAKVIEETKEFDVIAINPEVRDFLVDFLKKQVVTLGDDDSEKIYTAYLVLKNAPLSKMTQKLLPSGAEE